MILHKYGKIILGFCDNVKTNQTNPDRCLCHVDCLGRILSWIIHKKRRWPPIPTLHLKGNLKIFLKSFFKNVRINS